MAGARITLSQEVAMPKKTEEEKQYWKELWAKAYNQMPWKIWHFTKPSLIEIREVPIWLYIKLEATGNIMESSIGKHRLVTTHHIRTYRSFVTLAMLMGTANGRGHLRASRGMYQGLGIRNPMQHARLRQLAENGNAIAWEFFRQCGVDHKYSNEEIDLQWVDLFPKHRKKKGGRT